MRPEQDCDVAKSRVLHTSSPHLMEEDMSKLEEILDVEMHDGPVRSLSLNSAELKNRQKLQIKILMLDIFAEALKAESIEKMGEIYRQKVSEL